MAEACAGSWPARARSRAASASREASRSTSASHLAVFSVAMPSSVPRLAAAAAEGAKPFTLPAPCSASQAASSPARAVVFPVPAGPTITSQTRPRWLLAPPPRPGRRPWSRYVRAKVAHRRGPPSRS